MSVTSNTTLTWRHHNEESAHVRTTESLAPGSRRVADEPFTRIVVCVEYFRGTAREGIRVEPRADVVDLPGRDLRLRHVVRRRRTSAGPPRAVPYLDHRIGCARRGIHPRELHTELHMDHFLARHRPRIRQWIRLRHADPGALQVVPR